MEFISNCHPNALPGCDQIQSSNPNQKPIIRSSSSNCSIKKINYRGIGIGIVLCRFLGKLTLEMAETHMRRMTGAWGLEFCRPFPVPGKLGFFYVHTRSVHGAVCLTSSSDGRRTRRYPKHETGQDGEDNFFKDS